MRVFALSDLHVDYEENARWVENLSAAEYQNDVLILAGDVTDSPRLLGWCLEALVKRFQKVLFVPGNHDLWVVRERPEKNSLHKFDEICGIAEESGASMQAFCEHDVSIIPLLTWYDYSFGEPGDELKSIWMDYRACRWPFSEKDVAAHFSEINSRQISRPAATVITYSHFLPRIDLMPEFIPESKKLLYPILGSSRLDLQLRRFNPAIHVYGHSHVNQQITIDGVSYINNAFGYPSETRIAAKRLMCIHEC